MANEDLNRDARKANREDIEKGELLASMMKHPGWEVYEKLLSRNIEERTKTLFEPLEFGKRDASEHNKGAVYGLLYARDLPRTIVVAMKELVKSSPDDQPAGE